MFPKDPKEKMKYRKLDDDEKIVIAYLDKVVALSLMKNIDHFLFIILFLEVDFCHYV